LTKHSGPLLGYNNNIPYKGNVYHVQTEDSGTKRPHVFTHLFADGGRIVKTMKTSYAHFVGAENLTDKVRALMREQHKAMVISLRDGDLDVLIDKGGSEIEERQAPQSIVPIDENGNPTVTEAEEETPAEPIELTERAEGDDREFIREMEESAASQKPGADRSAGTYSFVGGSSPAKASGAPLASQAPSDEEPPTVARPDGGIAFGASFVSPRRFDQVVRAFLEGQG
jgi:hypothetical protein